MIIEFPNITENSKTSGRKDQNEQRYNLRVIRDKYWGRTMRII